MIQKFRESKVLTWEGFNANENDFVYYVPFGFFGAVVSLIFTLCMTAGPLWLSPAIFVPLGILMFGAITMGPTNMGRLHVLNKVPVNRSWSYSHDLRERCQEYLSLPRADRALYPHNIIGLCADPDLTVQDKMALDKEMSSTYGTIRDRNKKKADFERELKRRDVDVKSVLEQLKDSQASVRAEASVWSDETIKYKQLL